MKNALHSFMGDYCCDSALFLLFRKQTEPSNRRDQTIEIDKAITDFGRIRCPKCNWNPTPSSRWFCSDCLEPEFYLDGCGTAWNTFNTAGICPGCGHRWRWTSCLSCAAWSLHDDWYSKESEKA